MFFAFFPISFCLVTALMSPLTVLDAFDFHALLFSELHFDQIFLPCPTYFLSHSHLLLNFFSDSV